MQCFVFLCFDKNILLILLFVIIFPNLPTCDSKSIAIVPFNGSIHNYSSNNNIFESVSKFVGTRVVYDQSLVIKVENDRALTHAQVEFVVGEANNAFLQTVFESSLLGLRYEQYSHLVAKQEFDEHGWMKQQPNDGWSVQELNRRLGETEFERTAAHYGINLFLTNLPIVDLSDPQPGHICGKENWVFVSFNACKHITDSPCIANLVELLGLAWVKAAEQQNMWKEHGPFVVPSYIDASLKPNTVYFSQAANEQIAKGIYESEMDQFHQCFLKATHFKPVCGNLVLEHGEQCDDGVDSACCTANCTLRQHAQCTPMHDLSCTHQCRIKPRGEQCIAWDPRHCLAKSKSDGLDPGCTKPQVKLPDFSECWLNPATAGRCIDGTCNALAAPNDPPEHQSDNSSHSIVIWILCGFSCILFIFLGTFFAMCCQKNHREARNDEPELQKWKTRDEVDSSDNQTLIPIHQFCSQ